MILELLGLMTNLVELRCVFNTLIEETFFCKYVLVVKTSKKKSVMFSSILINPIPLMLVIEEKNGKLGHC